MRAKRSLGQNFLVGEHYPQRIIAAVEPRAGETIIEIGPGHGALTSLLIDSGARAIAIELDRQLIPKLQAQFVGHDNFTLIERDALEVDFCPLIAPATTARVVANLPYYISTAVLQRLIEQRSCLTEMTLMLQREVVDRITAAPGGKEYGYLSILVQFYCEAEPLFDVPPSAFRPTPKVWSSVVRLRVRQQPAVIVDDETRFIELAKTLFAQRRKTILNNLKAGWERLALPNAERLDVILTEAGLDGRRRAETLSLAEMAALANRIGADRIGLG